MLETFIEFFSSIEWLKALLAGIALLIAMPVCFAVIKRPDLLIEGMRSILNSLFLPLERSQYRRISSFVTDEELEALREEVEALKKANEATSQSGENSDKSGSVASNPESVAERYRQYHEMFSVGGTYRITTPSKMIDEMIAWKMNKPVSEKTVEDLFQMRRDILEEEMRWRQQKSLEEVFEQQLASASSIRGLMINLFAAVNIAVIVALFFITEKVAASKEIIFGLYVSFATFMVYVYRSSNSRALVLLAGKEDLKKYYDAEKYILSIGRRAVSERDVDILKLLMLNRMERERGAEHPYELVLKGISNSNILMKGGKIATVEKKEKKADKEN